MGCAGVPFLTGVLGGGEDKDYSSFSKILQCTVKPFNLKSRSVLCHELRTVQCGAKARLASAHVGIDSDTPRQLHTRGPQQLQ